jgi:hypothetical protein
MNYIWLSFRNVDLNLNLGCAIISNVNNVVEAVDKAWELGINPGGEVMSIPMSEKDFKQEGLESDRLYTRKELIEKGYKVGI